MSGGIYIEISGLTFNRNGILLCPIPELIGSLFKYKVILGSFFDGFKLYLIPVIIKLRSQITVMKFVSIQRPMPAALLPHIK